jgi:hypothetical protein
MFHIVCEETHDTGRHQPCGWNIIGPSGWHRPLVSIGLSASINLAIGTSSALAAGIDLAIGSPSALTAGTDQRTDLL